MAKIYRIHVELEIEDEEQAGTEEEFVNDQGACVLLTEDYEEALAVWRALTTGGY